MEDYPGETYFTQKDECNTSTQERNRVLGGLPVVRSCCRLLCEEVKKGVKGDEAKEGEGS